MTTERPVCGRAEELRVLDALVADTGRGRGSVAVVTGAAGIGKSLVLQTMCDRAVASGAAVLAGAAREREQTRPFGVFLDALKPRRDDPHVAAALELARGEQSSSDRFLVQDSLLDLLERLALHQPTVLALDDVQWLDAATLALLPRLATLASDLPMLLVLACRPASGSDHLRSLARHQLPLPPLDAADVAEMVANQMRRTPGPRLLGLLARGGGNPLFITEILQELERDGALVAEGESIESADGAVLTSARQAILSRLAFLSEEALEVLRTAAVLGATFTVADVAAVLGRPASDIGSRIQEAWRAGIVVEASEAMRFQHDIVHEAIYADLPESVRRALHLEVGRGLAAVGAPAGQVAAHMALGARRGDEAAIRWIGAAAHQASSAAPAVAADLFERLVDLLPADDARRVAALSDLGFNRLWAGDMRGAEVAARTILETATEPDDLGRADRLLGRVLLNVGRFREAVATAERAVQRGAPTSGERAQLLAELAVATVLVDVELGRRRDVEALASADTAGSPSARLRVLASSSVAAFVAGDFPASLRFSEQCQECPREPDSRHEVAAGNAALVARGITGPPAQALWALFAYDEVDRALREGRAVVRDLEARGLREMLPSSLAVLAGLGYFAGRWDDALVDAESALALMEEMGVLLHRQFIAGIAARIAAHRGDTAEARRWMRIGESTVVDDSVDVAPMFAMSRAAVLWREGAAPAAAADIADRAWNDAVAKGALGVARTFATERVRISLAAGRCPVDALDVMEEVSRRSPGIRSMSAVVGHCRGLLAAEPGLVLGAARIYADVDAPADAMLACEDAGVLLATEGHRDDAKAALGEAAERADALGAHSDGRRIAARLRQLGVRRGGRGARGRPATGWEALTDSELRVVELAARGLTNREVGDRLYLSARTVESHLAHVYRKLGVSTRAELALDYGHQAGRTGSVP